MQRAFSTDKINRRGDAAIGIGQQFFQIFRIFRIIGRFGSRAHCRLQFIIVQISNQRRRLKHFQRKLHCHHADPAKADNQDRFAGIDRFQMFQRAIGSNARTHISAGQTRRDITGIKAVTLMRHKAMAGKAAGAINTKRPTIAQILAAIIAIRAIAAANPRKHHFALTDCDIGDIGADRYNDSLNFMTKGEGQLTRRAHIKLFAVTDIKIAVMKMHIGMAYAAVADFHQHFAAGRCRCFDFHFTQWPAKLCNRLCLHCFLPLSLSGCYISADHSRASVQNASMLNASARSCGSMPASSKSLCGSEHICFRDARNIFRR